MTTSGNSVRPISFIVAANTMLCLILATVSISDASAQTNTFPSSGNAGVGTTSPYNPFVVQDNDDNYLKTVLIYNTNTATTAQAGIQMTQGSNTGYIFQQNGVLWLWNADGPLFFATQSSLKMLITAAGNVGIGTSDPASKLHVVGDVTVDGNISAKYQDIAEWVPAASTIVAGSVVVVDADGTNSVLPSTHAYDTRVAGVVSAQPGIVLGEEALGKVKVATTGRVKLRVDASKAPIRAGDLLVTSDKEGMAMRSEPLDVGGTTIHRPGTLIGKALETLRTGEGEILVLLSLQ